MSAVARSKPRLTVAAFRATIAPYPDEERWELLDGEAVLMAPQSERHQTIVMNILRSLDGAARNKGCRVLPGLGLLNDAWDDYAPIPDIVVRCGPVGDSGYATDPVLVAEVLSPSTMSDDRGRKLDFFRALPSLQLILIVYADEVRVESWTRDGEGWTRAVHAGTGAAVAVAALGTRLTLEDVYADTAFGA